MRDEGVTPLVTHGAVRGVTPAGRGRDASCYNGAVRGVTLAERGRDASYHLEQ